MNVHLDHDRCQGHGQCNLSAPDIFVFDEQGFPLLTDAEVPAGREDAVRLAELRCPERAIAISG